MVIVKLSFFVFWKKYKSFCTSSVILLFLFPFNSFAGKVIDFKKIREAYKRWVDPSDFMVSSYEPQGPNAVGKLKAVLRIHNEDFFLEDATTQEIFEYFKGVFKRTDKGTDSHSSYTEVIFSAWEDRAFRGFIFDSIKGEDLYKPDFLLKWWGEARALGVESRLTEYTEASLNRIKITGQPDPFMESALLAVKENEDFAWDWNLAMRGIKGIDDEGGITIDWNRSVPLLQDFDDA